MKRPRISLTISLLLLAAVAAVWARSYWRLDVRSRVGDDGKTEALASYQGALHFIAAATNARPRAAELDTYRIPAGATYATLHRSGWLHWHRLGFAYIRTTVPTNVPPPIGPRQRIGAAALPPGIVALPFGNGAVAPLAPWLAGGTYEALVIPYWPIALLAGLYPLFRVGLHVRAIRRRRRGQCAACGYDLRASPGRCPECGTGEGKFA